MANFYETLINYEQGEIVPGLAAKSELYHGMWRAHLSAMDWDIVVKGEGKQC